MTDPIRAELESEFVARQAALTELLRVIGSSGSDLETVLEGVLETARRLCKADMGTVYLRDGDVYRVGAGAGEHGKAIAAYERDHPDRPGRHSLTGRVLMTGRMVQIEDVLADPEYDQPEAMRIGGFRSMLGLPIVRDDAIIGVFNLGRAALRPFTESEIALVSMFAEQTGVAIENARLIETIEHQKREHLDRQTALNEILRIIGGSTFDLQAVLDMVVGSAARLANAEFANLYLGDEGGTYRLIASLMKPAEIEYERSHPHQASRDSAAGRVILTGEVAHIEDILADPEYTFATGIQGGYRTLLGVPLHREGLLLGAMVLARTEVSPFSDAEILLASTFAEQAGVAIENARLIETIEGQKREYLDRQTALNEILRIIGGPSIELQEVLDTVVASAARLSHAEYANLYLDDGTGSFGLISSMIEPAEAEYERAHPHRASRGSLIGRVMMTGDVVHIEDILVDPEYTFATGIQGGYRTLLGVPIHREGRLIGAMALVRKSVQPFDSVEILVVSTFGEQAAIAIENARLIETVERQKTELSRFVSPQIAGLVSSAEGEQLLAGHRRLVTAVFADLRGFSQFAETAEPEELLGVLREYHGAMGTIVVAHEGTLEHFAGDGMLVFFNDPIPQDDHASRAVAMAVSMRERFAELADGWRKLGFELGIGIGIATGYATLGRIGYEGRYDYAAIGTAVILASRLSTEAKAGQILIGQRTLAAVESEVDIESVGELTLKGISRPMPAFNVLRRATGAAVGASVEGEA